MNITLDRPGRTGTAFAELTRSVHAALETYANVHRGSGHHSLVTTHLYEEAGAIVLDFLGLDKRRYVTIFGTPRRLEGLAAQLEPDQYRMLSSTDFGLPLGIRALAVRRSALPGGAPHEAGGGTARLVAPQWVLWANAPDRFEPGTPPIVNVIAFARALQLVDSCGQDAFRQADPSAVPEEWPAVPPFDPAAAAAAILHRDELEPLVGHALLAALRQALIGRNYLVPSAAGATPFVNLDNGASTPTFAPVWEAVRRTWAAPPAVQAAVVREAKTICAGFLGAPQEQFDLILTSNTTEAIHLVAESLRREAAPDGSTVVVNTLLEHNSNELPWRTPRGLTLLRVGIDSDGFIDLPEMEALLRAYNEEGRHGAQRIKLVTVSGASNVLGVCNDLPAISRLAHRYGARLLVDAAQLVAHREIRMHEWEIDYLVFSGHKAYAPFGTGVLAARKGLLAFGAGELARICASGEENAGGIAALGKALVLLARAGMDVVQAEEQELAARALRGMHKLPNVTVYGIKDPDAPAFAHKGGVIIFDVSGVLAGSVAEQLAAAGGIGVRSGCHCAHLTVKRVLKIPFAAEQLQGVIFGFLPAFSPPGVVRVSFGIENTADDVDAFLAALSQIHKGTRLSVRQQLDDCARAAARKVYAEDVL
jgi:selenocysteine lyase/cysteine desulfurase